MTWQKRKYVETYSNSASVERSFSTQNRMKKKSCNKSTGKNLSNLKHIADAGVEREKLFIGYCRLYLICIKIDSVYEAASLAIVFFFFFMNTTTTKVLFLLKFVLRLRLSHQFFFFFFSYWVLYFIGL